MIRPDQATRALEIGQLAWSLANGHISQEEFTLENSTDEATIERWCQMASVRVTPETVRHQLQLLNVGDNPDDAIETTDSFFE